jgi:hypothetical protein
MTEHDYVPLWMKVIAVVFALLAAAAVVLLLGLPCGCASPKVRTPETPESWMVHENYGEPHR